MRDTTSNLIADIYEAAGAMRMSGAAIARTGDVTLAQWHLLDAIEPHTTVARAARRMGLTRQAVQRVANELERLGLLAFEPNPDHKTSPLLALTGRGADVLERLNTLATESHDARFGDLSEVDLKTTAETLRAMTRLTYEMYADR